MWYFIAYECGYYYLYDAEIKELKYYTARQVQNLMAKGVRVDKYSNFEDFVIAMHNDNKSRKTFMHINDIEFIYYDKVPIFLIRHPIKIPKIAKNMEVFYKGIHAFVFDSNVPLDEESLETGKQMTLSPARQEDELVRKYMKDFYCRSEQDYATYLQEFFSCLSQDNMVLMYNIIVNNFGPNLDLCYFKKKYKVGKSLITPAYTICTNAFVQQIKFNELMYMQTRFIRRENANNLLRVIDCTSVRKKEWGSNITVSRAVLDCIRERIMPFGIVVFSKSSAIIEDFPNLLTEKDKQYFQVISLGNVKRRATMQETLKEIGKQQGKYALLKGNTQKLIVFLVNLV